MRDALALLEGERITVHALFKRAGRTTGPRGAKGIGRPTVLFGPVHTATGDLLCDHCWLRDCAGFTALDLRPGAVVAFTARVTRYTHPAGTIDYKLTRPTKITLLRAAPPDYTPAGQPDPAVRLRRNLDTATGMTESASNDLGAALHVLTGRKEGDWYRALLHARGALLALDLVFLSVRTALQDLTHAHLHTHEGSI